MPEEPPYVTVKIPKELADDIDDVLHTKGYRSRGEFVKEAVRKRLAEIKTESSSHE